MLLICCKESTVRAQKKPALLQNELFFINIYDAWKAIDATHDSYLGVSDISVWIISITTQLSLSRSPSMANYISKVLLITWGDVCSAVRGEGGDFAPPQAQTALWHGTQVLKGGISDPLEWNGVSLCLNTWMDLICVIPRVLTPAELSKVALMKLKGVQGGLLWASNPEGKRTQSSHWHFRGAFKAKMIGFVSKTVYSKKTEKKIFNSAFIWWS